MCAPYFPGEMDFSPPCALPLPPPYVHWGNRGNWGNMCIYTLLLRQNVCPIFPRRCEVWRSGLFSSMRPPAPCPLCALGKSGKSGKYVHLYTGTKPKCVPDISQEVWTMEKWSFILHVSSPHSPRVHWGNRGNRGNMCIYTLLLRQNVCPISAQSCEIWGSGPLSSM